MLLFGLMWINCVTVPDDEVLTERKRLKSPYLCGLRDLTERRKLHFYIKLTSNGAGFCAEMKKSHNLAYQQENKHEQSEVFVFT